MSDIIEQAVQIVKQSEELTYEQYSKIIDPLQPQHAGTPKWEAFWKQNIELSQRVHNYELDEGVNYPRIPYGKETSWAEFHLVPHDTCHDCAIKLGQLHVPGCDMEACPKCSGQSISCGCGSEE